MRKGPSTRVDEQLGREICLRDGGIGMILTSRVDRAGARYIVSASLIDVATAKYLASRTEPAPNAEAVPDRIRKIASVMRRVAGDHEAGSIADWERLQRVTTPSLSALKLYTEAFHLTPGNPWPEAERLSRAALEEDPDFAAAQIWLAYAIGNQRPNDPEVAIRVEKAVALSATATDHERQFILASRLTLQQRDEEAVPAFRRLLSVYPEDYWSRNNLMAALRRLGRREEAAREMQMLSDLRPNEMAVARDAFWESIHTSNLNGARKYGDRLLRLEDDNPGIEEPRSAFTDRMIRLHRLWLDGELEQIPKELDLLARLPVISAAPEGQCATIVNWNQSLGRLRAAATALARCPEEDYGSAMRAVTAYYRDNAGELQTAVRDAEHAAFRGARSWEVAVLAARPDWDIRRVRQMDLPPLPYSEDALSLVQAHFDALEGDLRGASDGFRQGGARFARSMRPPAVVQCALARAQELAGSDADALRSLEAADIGPVSFYVQPGTSTLGNWHRIRYERARMLRKVGRRGEADDIEASLKRELRLADSDFDPPEFSRTANRPTSTEPGTTRHPLGDAS